MARPADPRRISSAASRINLAQLRKFATQPSPATWMTSVLQSDLLALVELVDAADSFIEARWLGSRERLEKAVRRFDLGG